ncbi:MAG: phycobilisome rod-core linker polypeptide [Synechococcales bacterium]|nr:phycobilisome rod-core linker polypeptide [Synechococcales bacterium]
MAIWPYGGYLRSIDEIVVHTVFTKAKLSTCNGLLCLSTYYMRICQFPADPPFCQAKSTTQINKLNQQFDIEITMAIPLLNYPLSSQNQRVAAIEVPGDEHPRQYTLDNLPDRTEMDEVIWAAYRQIYNEQQLITAHRQVALESQLRNGQLTVRDFVWGLLLSDSFRRLNYETNSNYRFVELCIQRVLGRPVYNEREKLAWSIVLATKGIQGFVDQILDSEEYAASFGDHTVPYQRRRILPQRDRGELPFARMSRYDSYHLDQLYRLGQLRRVRPSVVDRSAAVYRKVLFLIPTSAVALLVATLLLVAAPR